MGIALLIAVNQRDTLLEDIDKFAPSIIAAILFKDTASITPHAGVGKRLLVFRLCLGMLVTRLSLVPSAGGAGC
ncbi:MAG: hypothetical protein KME26_05315 [Oscillatoria princeps RMCB-10]|nr:hypothetical protein [Oscillatoria princeps RMCB-10]